MTTPHKYRAGDPSSSLTDPSIPRLLLKWNPFPSSPSVTITTKDNRLNGGLFNPKVRESTITEFKEKFINIDFNYSQHLQLGFLWSLSAGESKGFGKTALLAYYLRQINKDYGIDLISGQKVASIYAKPTSQESDFRKLAALVCDSLLLPDPLTKATILTDAVRTIRYNIVKNEHRQTLFPLTRLPSFEKEEDFELLTNPTWVDEEWALTRFDRIMFDYLVELQVREDAARALSIYHDRRVFEISELMKKRPIEFLFNDTVSLLRAAGFNGLYIFIDDLVDSVTNMSEKGRDTFANDIRHWFIDGPDSRAARERFFTSVMIFHPDLERLLSKSWGRARLSQIASFAIDQSPGNNVVLGLLDKENTIELLKAYTRPAISDDKVRDKNPLHPLTEETAEILMVDTKVSPGALLKKAYELIEQAKRDGVGEILTHLYVKSFTERYGRLGKQDQSTENYLDAEFG